MHIILTLTEINQPQISRRPTGQFRENDRVILQAGPDAHRPVRIFRFRRRTRTFVYILVHYVIIQTVVIFLQTKNNNEMRLRSG